MTRPTTTATEATAAGGVPPWILSVGAMLSVQLGSALSVPLIGTVGAAGTAWLRLSIGALVFLVLARPPLRSIRRSDLPPLVGLGVISGLVTICFLAAIERIPLGTAVAVEFLGPLTVAAIRSHTRRALIWPGLALVGVIGLTEPWHGAIDGAGLGFAVLGAIGLGGSIVLTQHVGDRFSGVTALSLTVPIAAATAAVVGVPQAAGHLSLQVVAAAAGLALLFPVLQYALDLLALRRMTPTAFGTLMALEPAIGLLLGILVLSQHPLTPPARRHRLRRPRRRRRPTRRPTHHTHPPGPGPPDTRHRPGAQMIQIDLPTDPPTRSSVASPPACPRSPRYRSTSSPSSTTCRWRTPWRRGRAGSPAVTSAWCPSPTPARSSGPAGGSPSSTAAPAPSPTATEGGSPCWRSALRPGSFSVRRT